MKTLNHYQIIELGGRQYLVRPGDVIDTNKLTSEPDKPFKIDKVLLDVNEDKVELGMPYLKSSFVDATVIKHFLGSKIVVSKFKAKTGYRRNIGYRSSLSRVRIDKLN